MIRNAYGKGTVWFITLIRFGARSDSRSGIKESNGLFGFGISGLPQTISALIHEGDRPETVETADAPDGLEIHIRRKGADRIVHFLNWLDDREAAGLNLLVSLPGSWTAFCPAGNRDAREGDGPGVVSVRSFRGHEMLVIRVENPWGNLASRGAPDRLCIKAGSVVH